MEKLTKEKKAQVLDKVRKCLALAMSDNINEAKLAAKRAAELLEKYGLSTGDLKTEKDVVDHIEFQSFQGVTNRRRRWEAGLYNHIARAFDCTAVVFPQPPWKIEFIGTKQDIDMVIYFCIFLRRWVAKSAEAEYQSNISDRYAYAWGMVARLRERLEEFTKTREEIQTPDTKALIVVKHEAAIRARDNMYKNLKSSPAAKINGSRGAYINGYKRGGTVPLAKPIEGNRQQSLIQ